MMTTQEPHGGNHRSGDTIRVVDHPGDLRQPRGVLRLIQGRADSRTTHCGDPHDSCLGHGGGTGTPRGKNPPRGRGMTHEHLEGSHVGDPHRLSHSG